MKNALYASLAIIPWIVLTLMLRWLIGMQGWPVGLVGTVSRCISLPILGFWILTTGSGWQRLQPQGQGGWLALMGFVAIIINLTLYSAVQWTTATNVGMLIRMDVLFVVLIGALLGLERIGRAQLALLPPMFVGLALLVEIQKFDLGGHLTGDLMTVVSAFFFSINAFVIRHIMRVMKEDSVALYNHASSGIGFAILGVVHGDFAVLADPTALRSVWLPFLLLGIVVAFSLPLYYVALRRMDVWKLRMFMLSIPVLTAAVEWPLWGLKLEPLQCLGGAIILVCLAVLIRLEWKLPRIETADDRS